VIFHSYVKLPEGKVFVDQVCLQMLTTFGVFSQPKVVGLNAKSLSFEVPGKNWESSQPPEATLW